MRHTVATSLSEHTIMNRPSSGAPHDDAFTAANAGNVSARRMWRGKWRCQSCTGFRKDTHRHSNHRVFHIARPINSEGERFHQRNPRWSYFTVKQILPEHPTEARKEGPVVENQ